MLLEDIGTARGTAGTHEILYQGQGMTVEKFDQSWMREAAAAEAYKSYAVDFDVESVSWLE